jgi:hypothetical protein
MTFLYLMILIKIKIVIAILGILINFHKELFKIQKMRFSIWLDPISLKLMKLKSSNLLIDK